MHPLHYLHLNLRAATMLVEAQQVMAMRLLAMTGASSAEQGENWRMVDEKLPTFIESFTDANIALLNGDRPDAILQAGLAPIRKKVRANKTRLSQ